MDLECIISVQWLWFPHYITVTWVSTHFIIYWTVSTSLHMEVSAALPPCLIDSSVW